MLRRFAHGTLEVEVPIVNANSDRVSVDANSDRVNVDSERLLETEVAEIVHDLKNPLSAITLEAVLLEDKLARGDRTSGSRSIARINHNVAFLDRLVLDLLDVCALATGHFQLYREPTDLRTLLADVCRRLSPERAVLDASASVTLAVDPLRIERVVANLIDNALKYSSPAASIVVRLTGYGGGACVSVIDTGPGIAASELTYIFDRYRRAASAGRKSGCGLGLYVCKRIVEAHGGQIGVESIKGAGSRFFFELPAS
ncbi:MAG TPA: HAMP domain-containing sensor histidine kinase [Kofleriaceae bacterium]